MNNEDMLNSFPDNSRVCIFGASGGIGRALIELLDADPKVAHIYAGSRTGMVVGLPKVTPFAFDLENEDSIAAIAAQIKENGPLHLVFIATGILSTDTLKPEKSWAAQDPQSYAKMFAVNTIGPAIIGKHFLPLLSRDGKSVFAALSARVGSISDNRLGGWHAYRASKAALNMIVRNFALELGHRNKGAIAVTLHPGTVDTALSQPFQSGVAADKLFTPEYSAARMLGVLDTLTPENSGQMFAWDGVQLTF